MRVLLSGDNWTLKYKDTESPDTGVIKATVPGNFELDFIKAGLLEDDILSGSKVLSAEKYETYDFTYVLNFDCENPEKTHRIIFEGVDTIADYYLNGAKIGHSDNMLIGHTFTVDNLLKTGNVLEVKISSTTVYNNKASQAMNEKIVWQSPEISYLRRPAHTYGWDIMPRAVSAGIFKNVYLEEIPDYEIEELYIATKKIVGNQAHILIGYDIKSNEIINNYKNFTIGFKISFKDEVIESEEKIINKSGKTQIKIDNAKLWWPYGYGEPNLYDVQVILKKDGVRVAEFSTKFGIRTVKLNVTDHTETMGEFNFIVNGEPVYIRGYNWVPLSPYHSEDAKRLPKAIELLKQANANMIRCWGGNVYESDEFFNAMDELGILVWQDFGFGCACYPQDDEFKNIISREAEAVIKRLRNHASLAIWAGDNEIDSLREDFNLDPKDNVINRKILPLEVKKHDPYRDYLPSSPYVSEKSHRLGGGDFTPEQHLWGSREWFKARYYKDSPARFVSEMGVHGCVNEESLLKFISKEQLNDRYAIDWWLHSTDQKGSVDRIKIMERHIKMLFGELSTDYKEFVRLSQFVHAEGMKFFAENARNGKPYKTGLILWNFLDGWPQFSEALVDYYFAPKLGFSVLKRSYQPIVMTVHENNDARYEIKLINDTLNSANVNYKVYDADTNAVYAEGEVFVEKNGITTIKKIDEIFFEQKCVILEWVIDGKKYFNHFITGFPIYKKDDFTRWYAYLDKLEKLKI